MAHILPIRLYIFLACGLLFANISVYQHILSLQKLTVFVLQTGEGHATLIRNSRDKTLLIDTGRDRGILRAIGNTLPVWQRHLNAVILTGTRVSYMGGLPYISYRYALPTPITMGTARNPYGAKIYIDTDTSVTVIAPGVFSVSDGQSSLLISSSTQEGVYVLR